MFADDIENSTESDQVLDVYSCNTVVSCEHSWCYQTSEDTGCMGYGYSYDSNMPTDGGLYLPMVRDIVVNDVSGSIVIPA